MKKSALTLLLTLLSAPLHLQATSRPDAGQLLYETRPPAPIQRDRDQEMPELPSPEKPVTSNAPISSVFISGFRFTGNTIFSETELLALMAPYANRAFTLPELEQAASVITSAYRKQGYFLASVFFPPQTIAKGEPLTIEVVEGILDRIHVKTNPEETRIDRSILSYYANQLPIGKPLERSALTSMIMRTNELPNISTRLLLEPGTRPGTTSAILHVTEGDPYAFTVNLDNYGNSSTGEYHLNGSMELYSPLHIADLLTARVQSSTTGNIRNLQTSYTVPLIAYGTRLGLNANWMNYELGGTFSALQASGSARSVSLTLTQPLIRKRTLMLDTTIGFETRKMRDQIESIALDNQRLDSSLQLGISATRLSNMPLGNTTRGSLALVLGQLTLDDQLALLEDQSPEGLHTNGSYSKLNMSIDHSRPLGKGFLFHALSYGQIARKNLSSSQQLSLTGPSAVRAFGQDQPSADNGIISSAELHYLMETDAEFPGNLELSLFIDHAYATFHTNPLLQSGPNCRNLAGIGVGVTWFDPGNFSLQATAALKVAGQGNAIDNGAILARLIKRF